QISTRTHSRQAGFDEAPPRARQGEPMKSNSTLQQRPLLVAVIAALANTLACEAQPGTHDVRIVKQAPAGKSVVRANTGAPATSVRPLTSADRDELTSHTVIFSTTDRGVKKTIPHWGLDTSWPEP